MKKKMPKLGSAVFMCIVIGSIAPSSVFADAVITWANEQINPHPNDRPLNIVDPSEISARDVYGLFRIYLAQSIGIDLELFAFGDWMPIFLEWHEEQRRDSPFYEVDLSGTVATFDAEQNKTIFMNMRTGEVVHEAYHDLAVSRANESQGWLTGRDYLASFVGILTSSGPSHFSFEMEGTLAMMSAMAGINSVEELVEALDLQSLGVNIYGENALLRGRILNGISLPELSINYYRHWDEEYFEDVQQYISERNLRRNITERIEEGFLPNIEEIVEELEEIMMIPANEIIEMFNFGNHWPVSNINAHPYNSVVRISATFTHEFGANFGTQTSIGTGFMISPNTVLTAAHNLRKEGPNGEWGWNVQITAPTGSTVSNAGVTWIGGTFHEGGHNFLDGDFAIIVLQNNLWTLAPWFQETLFSHSMFSPTHMIGYPGPVMHESFGEIIIENFSGVHRFTSSHHNYARSGYSGGPITARLNGTNRVIGIVSGVTGGRAETIGVKINRDLLEFIANVR
jgi:V8-like Glu-specific endopeptidase